MYTKFQQAEFSGISMFIQGTIKFFFHGVPLFLLLTGYLNTKKEIVPRYYKGCVRILGSYLLFSVATIAFRHYYLGEEKSIVDWGHQILSFSAIPYAWYIEMWIGLFLLTPFLNILYRNIPSKGQKQILLLSLYLLTALPDLFNRYGMHLVPGYWAICYPLFFYFAGSYIKEYQPTLATWKAWGAILAICLINPVFNLLFIHDHSMIQVAGGTTGVFSGPMYILFFLICYRWNTNSHIIRTALESISKLSLDIFLCCYIFDALWYPLFQQWTGYATPAEAGPWFLVIVPTLFLSSYLTAWIKQKIFRF